MTPFPSDYYTLPDPSMPSGRRIDFPVASMPVSANGVGVNPSSWLENDGFSPGSQIVVHVPNVDLATSLIPSSNDIAASLNNNAPIILLDADSLVRLPYWAELDTTDPNPSTQMLLIHPARNLPEGDRIIVAIRNMRTSSGGLIEPSPTFSKILSGLPISAPSTQSSTSPISAASSQAIESHIDQLLSTLSKSGINRTGMFLTWDFTVASSQNITGRILSMRNQAFSELGSNAPSFTVTSVNNFSKTQNPLIARQVIGTFDVPSYLNQPGGPQGSTLNLGPNGLPKQLPGNIQHATFACMVPWAANPSPGASGQTDKPSRPVLYGKGLFSLATQMDSLGVQETAARANLLFCSTNFLGLDKNDELPDARVIQNISNFATIPDRLQQAILDSLFLGKLMTNPLGFASNQAFQSSTSHRSLIDTSLPLTYYGNSEGSLIGGAITAVSTQIHRAVLGVPSMDYALLLPRSIDFIPFFLLLDKVYPSKSEQQVIFDLLQMLWDRGETDGYVENLTSNPLPGTPPHQVLMQMAFGDHQVSNLATEIEARTLGAGVHVPELRPGRETGNPFWGLQPIVSYPYTGSAALFVWDDTNVVTPPSTNVPPTKGPDPHDSVPRAVPAAQQQLITFLETGTVIDPCGNSPCTTTLALPLAG